jgi:hypothetical protein
MLNLNTAVINTIGKIIYSGVIGLGRTRTIIQKLFIPFVLSTDNKLKAYI